ncbi:MAG: hypothetical protein QOI14_1522 [Actinomycetota bacterium]|nr:hypothetical protein [Actinomycetota bacterium]
MTGRRIRDEDGSTLPLIIFYAALSLALILLVVAATSLYLERKRLFTLADGAALAGAEAFDLRRVTVTGDGPRATLLSADVAAAVRQYLEGAPVDGLEQLSVERAESPDGRSAAVRLSAYWRPPMLTVLVPDGIRLDVSAVARSVFF